MQSINSAHVNSINENALMLTILIRRTRVASAVTNLACVNISSDVCDVPSVSVTGSLSKGNVMINGNYWMHTNKRGAQSNEHTIKFDKYGHGICKQSSPYHRAAESQY